MKPAMMTIDEHTTDGLKSNLGYETKDIHRRIKMSQHLQQSKCKTPKSLPTSSPSHSIQRVPCLIGCRISPETSSSSLADMGVCDVPGDLDDIGVIGNSLLVDIMQ
jgi:hypothetical protein